MIDACRRKYPGVAFVVGDASDLRQFSDHDTDLVVFSFNGIDSLDHEGRLRCLKEVRRVLAPAGAFIFSTHNRNRAEILSPWSLRHFGFSRNPTLNPLKLAARAKRYVLGILNHERLKSEERQNEDYAVINDDGDHYRFLSYHISPERQIVQLAQVGLKVEGIFDVDGRELTAESAQRSTSWMIYYYCRPLSLV
jgi:ubiquinone/menaquinone biosynthesis C-methylase UbiE